jgi:hypothetical protein
MKIFPPPQKSVDPYFFFFYRRGFLKIALQIRLNTEPTMIPIPTTDIATGKRSKIKLMTSSIEAHQHFQGIVTVVKKLA